jgi:hypothetical protein
MLPAAWPAFRLHPSSAVGARFCSSPSPTSPSGSRSPPSRCSRCRPWDPRSPLPVSTSWGRSRLRRSGAAARRSACSSVARAFAPASRCSGCETTRTSTSSSPTAPSPRGSPTARRTDEPGRLRLRRSDAPGRAGGGNGDDGCRDSGCRRLGRDGRRQPAAARHCGPRRPIRAAHGAYVERASRLPRLGARRLVGIAVADPARGAPARADDPHRHGSRTRAARGTPEGSSAGRGDGYLIALNAPSPTSGRPCTSASSPR